MDLTEILIENLPACLSFALILLLAPLEHIAPRVAPGRAPWRRLAAVGVLAAAAILTAYLANVILLDDLLAVYSHVRLFSIAKLPLPPAVIFLGSLLVVDFVNYGLHVLFHKIGVFWRFHAIHHADEHVAASTALLHHPLEILVQFALAMLVYMMFGVPIVAVTAYAFLAALHSVFSHANIRIRPGLDRVLRWVIVTPDMHRTHHSLDMREGNSNFGAIFPFWDRFFRTYVAHPAKGESALAMGLPAGEKPAAFAASALLLYPLVSRARRA